MLAERKKLIAFLEVFLPWIILLALLWLYYSPLAVDSVRSFLTYLIYFYSVLVPVGLVRIVGKQSVVERFGLQGWRYLALAVLGFVSLAVTFLSGIVISTAFLSVVLAPMQEEVFFRGYMLGRFRNEKKLRNPKVFLASVLLVAGAFALSHIFTPGIRIDDVLLLFLAGNIFGVVYWFGGTILPSAILHTVWNFFNETKEEYQFSLEFWFWIFLIILPIIPFFFEELLKRRKREEKGNVS